jgi:ATP-dependent helicase HrpB
MLPLPIDRVRDELIGALREAPSVVITAPTGSGKSTRVPGFVLETLPEQADQVWVVQPRRIAARMLAERVAEERGSELGDRVGFRTRFEHACGPRTQILFMTEGLLLRRLCGGASLRNVGAIVFDEFHERNLWSDLALATVHARRAAQGLDLRIVVMSATLDVEPVCEYLNPCPHLQAHGRTFPVDVRYAPAPARTPVWEQAATETARVADTTGDGDILVFMPGAHEIRRTIESAGRACRGRGLRFLPLHGALPPEEQRRAVTPVPGQRRVIVATNIAETSLTIPGVRHVIDSGLARISRHDPARGVNLLNLEPVSRASAEQRAGRAGREAPGTCTRLWSLVSQQQRSPRSEPEVRRIDLAEALLAVHALGFRNAEGFPWFEAPAPQAAATAAQLLRDLGAVDGTRLTRLGRDLSRLPLHPRLGCFFLRAARDGWRDQAALIAAVLSERPAPGKKTAPGSATTGNPRSRPAWEGTTTTRRARTCSHS